MPVKFLAGLLCLMLAGCASTNMTGGPAVYIPLNGSIRSKISSTSVFLGQNPNTNNNVVTQTLAAPQPVGQGGVVAGLIGSLFGSMIVSEKENERQQKQHDTLAIREELIKYNFAGKFRAELQHQITAQTWLHANYVQKEPKFLSGDYSSLVTKVSTDAILVFDTYYGLSPDLKTLSVTANVVLYPVSKQLKSYVVHKTDDNPALFHNRYTVKFSEHDKKHVAGFWTQHGRLMKALDAGIPALVRTAIADLNNELTPAAIARQTGTTGNLKLIHLKSGAYRLIGQLAGL